MNLIDFLKFLVCIYDLETYMNLIDYYIEFLD